MPVALALYILVAAVVLFVWHRRVTAMSRMAAIVLLALPLLFTGPALLLNRAYGPYDLLYIVDPFKAYGPELGAKPEIHNRILLDLFMQLAPWQHQVRAALANGEWPLWNPAQFSGSVLLGNAQSAPFDPVNLIGFLLPLDIATTFGATMTFFMAALFTFACAREFALTERASLIASAAFACSSAIAFNVGWPLGRAWTLLPFVLLAVRRVVRDRDLRAFVLLTVALVLLLVSGHPETALHVVTVGVLFGIFELVPVRSARAIGIAIAAGVVALLLTAIFLLPVMTSINAGAEKELRKQRAASQDTSEWIATPEHLQRAMRATFVPYYGGASWHTRTGEWEFGTARVGSIVLSLAIVASLLLFRRRDVRFLAIVGAITLLASWKTPFLAKALHTIPLYDITLNWRLGFVAALCFSLLAGIAFDAFATLRHARWIVLGIGVVLAILTAIWWSERLAFGVDRKLMLAGAIAELVGIVVILSIRKPQAAFAIILVALAAQRVAEDGNIYPAVPRKLFYPSVPIIDAIPRDPLYRAIGSNDILIPNISAMYGLDDIRGYDSLRLGRYEDTLPMWWQNGLRGFRDVNNLALPFLDLLAVKHAITPSTMEPPEGWRVIFEDRGSRLMENARALPRVFVPRRIRYTSDRNATLAEMAQSSDFAELAWIYAKVGEAYTADNAPANIRARRVGSRYEIDVDTPADARIVITESSWPGWRAYVDGKRANIELANHAFLSVAVPPGKHHVRVQYLPSAFVQGRAISLATLLLLGIAYGLRRFRRNTDVHAP